MARVNAGDPTAGYTYELTAITATIIGGTSLFGGKGSILGACTDGTSCSPATSQASEPARARSSRSASRAQCTNLDAP